MSETEQLPVLATEGAAIVPAGGGGAIVAASSAHAHPEPRQYVMIAVVLVLVTALEVATSYIDTKTVSSNLIILMLGTMAFVKFVLVVSWYMHLKTDSRALRRFFIVGLVGAILLYMVIALALHGFLHSYNKA